MPHFDTGVRELDAALLAAEAKLKHPLIYQRKNLHSPGAAAGGSVTPMVRLLVHEGSGTRTSTDPRIRVKGEDLLFTGGFSSLEAKNFPGVPIVVKNGKGNADFFLGSVHKNTVYVAWDFFTYMKKHSKRVARGKTGTTAGCIFQKIVDQHIAPALRTASKFLDKYDFNAEKAAYIKKFAANDSAKIAAAKEGIASLEREINTSIKKIEGLTRDIQHYNSLLKGYEVDSKDKQTKLERSFTIFNSLWGNGIHDIKFGNARFTFLTAPITIEGITLGRFVVTVHTSTRGYVTIKPETNKYDVNGYSHPHVSSRGDVCFGSAGTIIYQLLGRERYIDVIPVVLEFLRTYNGDNPYANIERWAKFGDGTAKTEYGIRWKRCFAKVKDPYECAGCWGNECPHREGAENRCYNKRKLSVAELKRCIKCGTCSIAAQYAMNACRDMAALTTKDGCSGCEVTSCKHAFAKNTKKKEAI